MLAISKFLGVWQDIKDWIGDIIGSLLSIIPKIMYLMVTFVLSLMDIIQLLFRKLAGLDTYYVVENSTSVTQKNGDILEQLVNKVFIEKGVLNDIFWGMVILGVCLLFLSSLVAVVRSQYMSEDAKSSADLWKKLMANILKAIVSFVVIPAVCVFGVFISNAVLNAIEGATNPSTTLNSDQASALSESVVGGVYIYNAETGMEDWDAFQAADVSNRSEMRQQKTYKNYDVFGMVTVGCKYTPFSGTVFRASASRASRVRNDNGFFTQLVNDTSTGGLGSTSSTFGLFRGQDVETMARQIDDAFANCYRLDTSHQAHLKLDVKYGDRQICNTVLGNLDPTALNYVVPICYFSKYNVGLVWYYYDLWKFDFIIAIASLVVLVTVFYNICLGLAKRIFEATALAIAVPGLIGLMPLDGGEMTKKWRQNFVKKVISAYAAVFVVNIVYVFLAEFENIKFFNIDLIDYIVNALFTIAVLISAKTLIATISEIIGAEDVNKAGSEMGEEFGKTVSKVSDIGMRGAAFAAKAATFASPAAFGAKMAGKGIAKKAKAIKKNRAEENGLDSILTEKSNKESAVSMEESASAREEYEKLATRGTLTSAEQARLDKYKNDYNQSGTLFDAGAFERSRKAEKENEYASSKEYKEFEANAINKLSTRRYKRGMAWDDGEASERGYEGNKQSLKRFESLEKDNASRARAGNSLGNNDSRRGAQKFINEGLGTIAGGASTLASDAGTMLFGSKNGSSIFKGTKDAKEAGFGGIFDMKHFFNKDGSVASTGQKKDANDTAKNVQSEQNAAQTKRDNEQTDLLKEILNALKK